MTLLAIVTEARRWSIVVLVAIAGIAFAVAVRSWRHADDAERALRAEKARADLRAKGDVPVEPVPDARPALAAAMQQNEAFAAQVEKLKRDLAGARAQLVVHAETEPAEILAPPRPPEPVGTPEPPCVLARGDQVKLKLDMAQLRGDDGVAGIAGSVEAWALRDMAEPVLLVRQPFSGKLTSAEELAPPAPPPKLPRFALGARAWWTASSSAPSSAEVNAGLRLVSGWWLDGAIRTDGAKALGFRREF